MSPTTRALLKPYKPNYVKSILNLEIFGRCLAAALRLPKYVRLADS
jgi:hypothetical protein